MAESQTATYTYKDVSGLSLTIDVSRPRSPPENGIVLIHFHGGFLVRSFAFFGMVLGRSLL
jgi:hypothetical protein